MVELYVPLIDGEIRLEPLTEAHRDGLRAACAEDTEIWEVYPFNFLGEAFDERFDWLLAGGTQRQCYAISQYNGVVGMTAWIAHGAPGWSIEIGNSYIVPRLRGTGFNSRFKKLMLNHAFGLGLRRVMFKVDNVNSRSQAAVLKLGCSREGMMRAERQTWTGRVRDTVLFSILADEWKQP